MKRRDFLKLAALLPAFSRGVDVESSHRHRGASLLDPTKPNVLILLFDTFSAKHASTYGYPRVTTPNLSRFAERATVYHKHYSAGSFTNPGTASLLTGTYPWTHRSLALFSSAIKRYERKTIFQAFESNYYTLAYTHNLVAAALLYQFSHGMNLLKPIRDLCLYDQLFSGKLFPKDYEIAVWRERRFRGGAMVSSIPSSLFGYFLGRERWSLVKKKLDAAFRDEFPRGLPHHNEQIFLLEEAIDWLGDNLRQMPQPFLGYFHFSPPHHPYNARRDFVGQFDDAWTPPVKPARFFSNGVTQDALNGLRMNYDEHVAYADAEFGRLYDALEASGVLDNTYVVVTSDHGELFERGIWMHLNPTLYEPLIHIPLLISAPGQRARRDVFTPTSSVDVLPTLLRLTDQAVPEWCEGELLPGFGQDKEVSDRALFALDAKSSPKFGALDKGTMALIRAPYKLTHYFGYEEHPDAYELYDIVNDPEELVDLYPTAGSIADMMREELLTKLDEINQPYR